MQRIIPFVMIYLLIIPGLCRAKLYYNLDYPIERFAMAGDITPFEKITDIASVKMTGDSDKSGHFTLFILDGCYKRIEWIYCFDGKEHVKRFGPYLAENEELINPVSIEASSNGDIWISDKDRSRIIKLNCNMKEMELKSIFRRDGKRKQVI